jgi:steroid delta-isomerase-like uncharacterized protein
MLFARQHVFVGAIAAGCYDSRPRPRPIRPGDRTEHAMTQDAARALIETYYAAFNRADWNAMLDCLAGDVVHDLNQGVREHGRDAFGAFLARMDRCYEEQLRDVTVFASADGMRAAAEYVVHGRYKATDEGLPAAQDQRYVLPGGAFFDLRSGRIARVTNYYNLQDWLRQVGA